MSTTSGPGNKGEKNKGKFKSIDINTLYKGKSVETQKSNVPRQYGLQSLGKVSSARRMPPPANLPSIKSENSGKDPSVNLVPSGGTGWVSKEEKKESSAGPPQQPSLPLQQAMPTQLQQGQQQVTTKTNNSSGGQSSLGVRSWSSATGSVRQGGLVSHRSPLFQEEFPSLAQEEKHKEPVPPTKKEDTVKDIQYGPGPSLRPQNVASWREGGGRALPQPKPEERTPGSPSSAQTEAQPNGPLMSGGSGAGVGVGADLPSQPLPLQRPNSSVGQPHGSLPLGPPMRMPPPQHRGMLPHYMFGRIPQGYPMTFPGFPRNPFPHDRRFRGPAPSMPVERSRSDGEESQKRPAIISEKALKDFDAVLKSDSLEGGWAEPQGDIDYNERLVFSDEEEDSGNSREVRRRPTEAPHQRDPDRDRDHKEDKDKEDEGGVMMHEGWPHGMPPPHYRGGPMPPHPGMDAHGWPPHMRPYEFLGPRGVAPYPFRLHPPMHMRGYGPPAPAAPPQAQPPVSSPGAAPPRKVAEDDDEVWRVKRRTNEGEINIAVERARVRREESEKKKETEQRAAADEKLRQLDERSKKKVDTKGSDTEDRDSRDTSESSDREIRESHHWNRPTNLTPPVVNDLADGKGYSRNVPPRFQKLQEPPMGQDQRQKQLPSPGGGASPGHPAGPPMRFFKSGQGPPPHFAGYDPRAWPGMPPHFHMDPRYGPRPPLDMQVYGPPTVMRRHDSHGSGNEGQESESRHLEAYERIDPWAVWVERGYHPQAGHYEDMRRTSYYERAYQGFDIDRRDFEHHDHSEGSQTDTSKSPKEIEQRPSPHQREPFEDWNKVSDKEDRRSDRSSSKDHTDWGLDRSFSKESNKEDSGDHYEKEEEFSQKPSKDELDQEETSYTRSYNRRDGRTGPTPKFRAYTSEEVKQREASQRAEAFSQNCPPPLSHDLSKQSLQAKASLSSTLKRSTSTSSSSALSSDKEKDRKNESPKESLIFERSVGSKKDGENENSKDEKSSQDNENKPQEQSRPNAWEIKEQDRQKVNKVKEETEVTDNQKEEDERVRTFEERVDSPRSTLKKKREDEQVRDREDEQVRERRDRDDEQVRDRRDRDDEQGRGDRRERYSDDRREKDYDRYSDRGERSRGNASRGGREFVRGRGAPRGSLRGAYNTGRGRDRDYFPSGYEKSGQVPQKLDKQPVKPFQKFDGDKSERDFDLKLPSQQKHGLSEDLSDVSVDDSFGVFNENTVGDKENLMEKDQNHTDFTDNRQQETRGRGQNKDFRLDQEQKNIWGQELKMQEEPIPSLFQNAWVKSQPLLPDPPKSDRISDDSSLAYQKGSKVHNINVWQQRLESRRPNIERAYGENHTSVPVDKHYDGNHRDGREIRQRHDRDRRGFNWSGDDQNERKERRDNDQNERKNRRDNDQNERKERRDNDPNERKEKRDNDPNERKEKRDDANERRERRDNDPNERKEKRDSGQNDHRERRENDPNERKERRENDPNERKERREHDPHERKDRRENDPNERKERRDNDPHERKERRENDPNERKERRDDIDGRKERRDDPNERKERRDDPNERKERRDDPNERKERRDDPNERKDRRDDPNERTERRDDQNERKERRDDQNERKERRDDQNEHKERNDQNERKERRDDPNERKERRENDSNEWKERRENDPNETKERREYDPNERKERRDNDPNERRDRRENEPNERKERRDNDPNERRDRRENEPNERKERRDKYRDRDRYRDRRNHYQQEPEHDDENGTSYPRGEQQRRGRGGSRSGRGGSRYTSNPSNYGGGGGQGYGGSNVSEHGGFPGDHLQNRERGHDGRDGHVDGRNHRRDGRRQDDRNPPPPRFRRDEGMFDHRGRGRSSRGQGSGTQSNSISKRPVLTKQMSNDGEEWETASESSEPKNGLRESRENMSESSTTKKGVSNQRPFSDRPSNHRLNYQDSRNSVERCNFHNRDEQQNQKNGVVPPTKSAANWATVTKAATVSIVSHKESITYRGDGRVTPDTADGSSVLTRKHADKKNEITDAHNKAVKAEQERKDALANIDINNIAGVVVIDDMQEVTLDDPDFLYEINDGFQEVTSKRTLKIKQKLIEAEHKKSEKEAQRKKEQHNKGAGRSKCMSPKSGHMSAKGNKLPPRLAKQKEQREKEKLMTKDVMPKIELWDNELANNLPCLDGQDIVSTSSMAFSDNIGVNVPLYTMTVTNKTSMAPVMMSFSMTPAPVPPINAWMKPISFSPSPALGSSQLQQVLAPPESHSPPQPAAQVSADVKMDKGDQHDSGIDVSDQPNSAASSSRSSPGTDNRLAVSATIPHSPVIDHSAAAVLKRSVPMDASQMITEMPKQQRLPKVSKSEKSYVKAEASATVMKKMDLSPGKELSDTKPEPIQMPPGYKDSIFGKGDHVGIELDFHYDESLSNSMAPISERPATPEKVEATFAHNENIHLSAPVATSQTLMPPPTSPATEVLTSKIASVKNFWDLDLPAYDHMACMTSAAPIDSDCTQSDMYVSNANTNNVSSTSAANSAVFPDFGPEIGNDEAVSVSENQPALLEEDTTSAIVAPSTVVPVAPVPRRSPVVQCMHSPHPAESAAVDVLDVSHSGMMIHNEKNMILEPSNVCKVRPQQLQMGLGLGNEAISMSMMSSGISGPMPTVASPPMMIGQHGFPAFQFGSQYVPQEARYTQPSFGYSLSQPQPPAGLGSQHQTPGPMGAQQTFNQPSLFISSTRTQAEYLSSSQLGFPQRGHGFGQPTAPAPPPAAQQSTILTPAATAALMPANLKVSGSSLAMGPGPTSAFGAEPLGKAIGPSQISFSNGLGNTSIPGAASQQLFFYDPNPRLGQLFQTHNSQIITGGQPSQNMANSQIMGSQLLQTRAAVQPSSAFYQQPPAAGYFPAQQSSTIQVGGPIQQASSNQFSVQAFGSQHHGLGLALQPPVSSLEMGNQNPSTLSLHGLPHQQSQALSMTASSKGSSFGSMVTGQQQTHQHFAATYNQQGPYSGHSHHPHHHLHSCGSQLNAFMGAGGPNTPHDHMSVKQFEGSHPKTDMTSSSNPNHFGDSMNVCPTGSTMMGGMLVGNTSYNACGNTKSSGSFNHGTTIGPLDGSHIGIDKTQNMSISGPPSPQPPPASQPPQKSLISRSLDTSTSHLNPNAPVFPATTKYSCSTAAGVPSTSTSNITSASTFVVPSGNSQHQPQISVGKTRPNASQVSHHVRPPFPNPIQRPDGPPVTPQSPDVQQFGPNNNVRMPVSQVGGGHTSHSNSSFGGPGPNPQYHNIMNFSNTALLNFISAAKNVIGQTLMSSGSHLAGDNPFAGLAPGAYMGPTNMDGPTRPGLPGPPTSVKGPPQSASHKSQSSALQHNTGPNLGQSQNPLKVSASFSGPAGSIKAQQALQRQELLTHAANFLNASKTPTANKPPPAMETSAAVGTTPVGHARKPGDRKPALAMVSNPGLVGTSVKINFTASSNSRAPALPATTSATVSATTSLANPNIKNSTNSSCTISVSATPASSLVSAVNSAGHKEGKEN